MGNKNIVEFALEIATEAHRGQKRRDGKEYITHPIAVAEIIEEKMTDVNRGLLNNVLTKNNTIPKLLVCAGLLHDVAEDTLLKENDILRKFVEAGYFGYNSWEYYYLYGMLNELNKNNYNSYKDYILRIKQSQSATKVKIADLTHNLSDLKPGSLRDKYELALHILEN